MGRTRASSELALRDQLERMSHRTTTINRMIEEYAAPLDATGWLAVRILQRHGPIRSSELAERAHLSRPAVSRCITALERAGLVASDPDPDDGRAALIRLTTAGRRHLEHVVAVSHDRIKQITHGFTATELDTLAQLLDRLNDSADEVAVVPARYRVQGVTA